MSEKIKIPLEWTPIKSYREIEKLENICAIYIWGFGSPDSFKPYYVGKSKNLKKRISEHLVYLLGGAYNIYEKETLLNFKNDCEPYYSPGGEGNMIKFIDGYEKIRPHLKTMLDNFYLTYAVVDNKNALSDLEKSVIKDIGKNNLVNNQSKEPQVYIHENCGDEKVVKILLTYKEGNSLNENITNPYRG